MCQSAATGLVANSVDPDQVLCSVASGDLVLHCLHRPVSLLWIIMVIPSDSKALKRLYVLDV